MLHNLNLFNKYRPKQFSDVKQSHVVKVLKKQIEVQQYANLYMFSGDSGTGKTTTARIVSMAILCENKSDDFEPCLKCDSCKSILNKNHRDVKEINCSANNGVDYARNLVDNEFRWQPTGDYKIYTFDETHMLTKDAQNTYLKIFEEPPPYLIFIACTTEPNKILPTIRNRSQYFHLKSISNNDLMDILTGVIDKEEIEYNTAGLELIIQNSYGSARKALVILEQVSLIGATEENIREVLGRGPRQYSLNLLKCIATTDIPGTYNLVATANKEGYSVISLVEECSRELSNVIGYRVNKTPLDQQDIYLREINNLYNSKQIVEAIRGLLNILKDLRNTVPQDILVQIGLQEVLHKVAKLN